MDIINNLISLPSLKKMSNDILGYSGFNVWP